VLPRFVRGVDGHDLRAGTKNLNAIKD